VKDITFAGNCVTLYLAIAYYLCKVINETEKKKDEIYLSNLTLLRRIRP